MLAATVLCLVGLVVGLSVSVDPYAIFEPLSDVSTDNRKPELDSHIRLHKAYAVRRADPGAVLLGTSRVEFGVRPEHPGLENGYNLALPGVNVYEAYRYLQHAWMSGHVEQAIFGIDLGSFSVRNGNRQDFSEARLALPEHGRYSLGILRDLLAATMSVDSLAASVLTLTGQSSPSSIGADGFRTWNELDYRQEVARAGGVVNIMRRREDADLGGYRGFATRDAVRGYDTLDTFRDMVRFAYAKGIDLRLFVSPSHARQWELMDAAGVWEKFERLKVDMVRIVEEEARRASRQPAPVWDFSGYNPVTTERVPAEGDATPMRWYWESSHYRPEVGYWVLCRVLEVRSDTCDVPRDFGYRLSGSNVDRWLGQIREARASFREIHPEITDEMRRRFDPVQQKPVIGQNG